MNALHIFLFMLTLVPLRGAKDYDFRWLLAESIVDADPNDEQLQRTLARIAWLESGFRRSVARCAVKGDHGQSLGAFQVKPIERGDARLACSLDLRDQARLAKSYVDRSAAACPQNTGPDTLNMYTSGRCNAGREASKKRWEPPIGAMTTSWIFGSASQSANHPNAGLGKAGPVPVDTALSGIE